MAKEIRLERLRKSYPEIVKMLIFLRGEFDSNNLQTLVQASESLNEEAEFYKQYAEENHPKNVENNWRRVYEARFDYYCQQVRISELKGNSDWMTHLCSAENYCNAIINLRNTFQAA
ncbi:MAG: hypothetical protein Q8N99_02355 [Nanoarchaeota archaeon]|nr:hypothetical protein [Nanoarchaeota archaeon]